MRLVRNMRGGGNVGVRVRDDLSAGLLLARGAVYTTMNRGQLNGRRHDNAASLIYATRGKRVSMLMVLD